METSVEILSVVEPHVQLRRAGRELVGLCPFHGEKSPSFAVNVEKNLFYCHGCHEGGDAIAFIMKLHGASFKDALKLLGIEVDRRPEPHAVRRREQARRIARWARQTSNKLRDRLHDIGERRCLLQKLAELPGADSAFIAEETDILKREWQILCTLDDDMNPWKFVEFTPEERERQGGKIGTWTSDGARLLEMFESRAEVEGLMWRGCEQASL